MLALKIAETPFPTLASASPEYRRLVEKRAELSLESARIQTELVQMLDDQRRRQEVDANVRIAGAIVESESARRLRIAKTLGEPTPVEEKMSGQRRSDELKVRLQLLQEAMVELDERIRAETWTASTTICENVASDHKQLVRALCDALINLHIANSAYHGFADHLNREGVMWSRLGPSQPLFTGDPRDHGSPVGRYLRDAREHGFLEASRVPPEFR